MNKAIYGGIAAGMLLVGLVIFQAGGFPNMGAQAMPAGNDVFYTLVASEKTLQVAPDNALSPGGIMYNAMVFNGTIPGPPIVANWGDNVHITLINQGNAIHSIDFHAALGNDQVNSGPVLPGKSYTWTWKAVTPGAFLYHCSADGLLGVWEHVASGMYGGVIVHAPTEKPAKQFYMTFGDMYLNNATGTKSFDMTKFLSTNNDLEVTNGMAFKYAPGIGGVSKLTLNKDAKPLMVTPGELTRWYIVNPGPNHYLAFHFISGQLDVRDGSIISGGTARLGTQLKNDETWTIPPGSASVIESTFVPMSMIPSKTNIYIGLTHALADVVKGGAFAVVASDTSTDSDIPPEAQVQQPGMTWAGSMTNMTNMTK